VSNCGIIQKLITKYDWRFAIIIILFLIGLLVGSSTALAARHQIRYSLKTWQDPYLPSILVFVSAVVIPVGIYMMASQPAWGLFYLTASNDLSGWAIIIVVLGTWATTIAGYLSGSLFCRRNLDRILICQLGATFLITILILIFADQRLSVSIDYRNPEQVLSQWNTKFNTLMALVLPIFLGGWIFILVLFELEGRRLLRTTPDVNNNGTASKIPVAETRELKSE
jgi:cadmium resistance protein CadD (predicted permease)